MLRKRAGGKRPVTRLIIDDEDEDEVENSGTSTTTSTSNQAPKPEENEQVFNNDRSQEKKLTVDEDITKLETPTFTTLERGPPEPMHQNKKLRWDHKVNLIGEKVINPRIHCCEKCSLPILIYGRMIPCKHVFCYDCARKTEKICPRCNDKVTRVEQSALGTVFMCTFGTTRHGTVGCRRTYLSQRDLQAHINHRHIRPTNISNTATTSAATHSTPATHNTTAPPVSVPTNAAHPPPHPRDPRHVGHVGLESSSHTSPAPHPQASHPLTPAAHILPHVQQEFREGPDTSRPPPGIPPVSVSIGSAAPQSRYSHPATTAAYLHNSYPSPIPVVSTRSNLITVPIQDDNATASNQHVHVQQHQPPPQYPTPTPVGPPHQPPPLQAQHPPGPSPYPPVPHHYQHPPPNAPQPAYSQAPPPPAYGSPPVNTQSFAQTHPPHVPPPPVHNAAPPVYSAPAPPLHHPPPSTYSSPNVNTHTLPPPPQRFPPSSPYDDATYSQPWGTSNVPPTAAHGPLPPRPLANPPGSGIGMPQPCAPTEQGYRPPYYQ